MWNNVRYIFLTAQRDSLFFALAIGILLSCYFAFFISDAAIDENQQMAMVYAAGLSRVILVLGLIIFISFHIRRSFENREIDLMIVRPISRQKFILSFWLGYSVLALFLVLFTTLTVYLFSVQMYEVKGVGSQQGFLIWAGSLYLETLIVAALTIAASLILKSNVLAVMSCLGFYVLSRMAGFVLLIATKPGNDSVFHKSFFAISSLVPRFDFFGKTEWLLYNVRSMNEVYLFIMQAAVYGLLLLTISIIDFKRKEF